MYGVTLHYLKWKYEKMICFSSLSPRSWRLVGEVGTILTLQLLQMPKIPMLFGICIDNDTGTYLVDNRKQQSLLDMNTNITLTLADQKVEEPQPKSSSHALHSTRMSRIHYFRSDILVFSDHASVRFYALHYWSKFVQEAYVTAHYNSKTFNVFQAVFEDLADATVVAIPFTLLASSSWSGSNGGTRGSTNSTFSFSSSLSGGDIAGIVSGVLAAVAVVGSNDSLLSNERPLFPRSQEGLSTTDPRRRRNRNRKTHRAPRFQSLRIASLSFYI